MSDLVDADTAKIIDGYIRNSQREISTIFPSNFKIIIVSYVGNHFVNLFAKTQFQQNSDSICAAMKYANIVFSGQNSGNFIWKIDGTKIISNILNLKTGEFYKSDPFTMTKLQWILEIYSNGNRDSNKGNVKIFLKLVSMPLSVNKINLCYSLLCINTMSCWSSMTSYTKNGAKSGWKSGILLLSQWKSMQLNVLSILVTIKINYIKLSKQNPMPILSFLTQKQGLFASISNPYKNKYKLIYQANKTMINEFKKSNNEKRFESMIFDNIWRIACCPNGTNELHKGYIGIYIGLYNISPIIVQIKTKGIILCKETKKRVSFTHNFNTKDVWSAVQCTHKFMKLSDINCMQSVTFIVDIEILDIVIGDNTDDNIIMQSDIIKQILSLMGKESTCFDIENETISGYDTKYESLSMNIEQNKNELEVMKQNVNNLMNIELSSRENKENKEKQAMKRWMSSVVRLPEYIDLFIENGMESLDIIKHITMNELTQIGIDKIGHKVKIIKEIHKLNQQENQQPMQYEGQTGFI